MHLGLKNKVALITGASAGLGKAIALELAREGVKVAISGRREKILNQTAAYIRKDAGTEVLTFVGDITEEKLAASFVERVIERWNKADILVNNVGQATRGVMGNLDASDWQNAFETNLLSAVNCTKYVLPYMKKSRWGRIINISALSGKEPGEELIASNVAKSGLLSFSKTLSRELASENILVNSVSPGLISSPQNDRYFTKSEREVALKNIPLGRFGEPEEFAAAVVFLCSERASFISGINLIVDGGVSHSI